MADAPKTPVVPKRSWFRRLVAVASTLLAVLGGLVALLLIGVAVFVIWLRTPAGNRFLTEQAVARTKMAMTEGALEIGGFDSDLFGRTVVTGVKLTDGEGKVLLGADTLVVSYDLVPLWGKRLQVDSLAVDGLVVDLRMGEDGVLDLMRLFGQTEPTPPSEEPWAGLPIAFDADDLGVRNADIRYRTAVDGAEDSDVHVLVHQASGLASGGARRIESSELAIAGTLLAPLATPFAAHGGVVYSGDGVDLSKVVVVLPGTRLTANGAVTGLESDAALDLAVGVDRLDLKFPAALFKQPLDGRLAGPVAVVGPLSAIGVKGVLSGVEGTPGTIDVDATIDGTSADLAWTGSLAAKDVAVESLYALPGQQIAVNGTFTGKGHGTKWPAALVVDGRFDGGPITIVQPGKTVQLDTVTGTLGLAGGVLTFAGVDTQGPLGHLGADGTLDLVSGALDTAVTGRVVGAGLADVGVEGLDSNPAVALRVTGNVLEDTLPLDVRGRAEWAPLVYGTDVRAEHAVASYTVKKHGDDIDVDADVTGEGLLAYGLAAASFTAPGVEVAMPASGALGVTGDFTLVDSKYGETVDVQDSELFGASTLGGSFVVAIDPAGHQDVTAAITVGEHHLRGGFPGSDGIVGVHVTDERVAFDVDLNADARDFVTVKGTFGRLDNVVALDTLVIAPTPRQAWRATEPVRMTITDGGVADAHIVVASNLGRVSIDGTLGTTGPLRGQVQLEAFELDTLAELFPDQADGLAGTLGLDARFSGVAEDPQIDAEIDGEGLWLPGLAQALDVSGRAVATRDLVDLALRIGSSSEPLATVDGTLPVNLDLSQSPGIAPDRDVDLAIVLTPGSIARIERLSVEPLGLPEGVISGVLSLTGELRDPDFTLDGVVEVAMPGWDERGRVELTVDRKSEDLAYWADLREGFAQRGHIEGSSKTRLGEVFRYLVAGEGSAPDYGDYTLFADDLDVKIAALGVPLRSLVALAGQTIDADGDLLGGVRITGGLANPVIAGGFNVSGGNIGGVELTGGLFTLLPSIDGFEVDARVDFPDGDVEVAGHVPLVIDLTAASETWVRGENALIITGAGIPLGVLRAVDSSVGVTAGRVVVSGTIGGAPFAPKPDLSVAIVDGLVEERSLGVRYTGINLDLLLSDTLVSLRKFALETEPIQDIKLLTDVANLGARGRVEGSGTIELEDWTPKSGRLTTTFDKAWVSNRSDQLLRISGPVVLEGQWPGRLHGDLSVDQGYIKMGASTFSDASAFAIDPSVTIHRDDLAPPLAAPVAAVGPSLLSELEVDIGIDLNRSLDVQVELPIVDDYGALGALLTTATVTARLDSRDLAITMKDGQFALVHDVEIVDGNVAILRSLLAVQPGSKLTFVGDPANPIINLTASMSVTGGSVELALRGPLDPPPEPVFTSEQFAPEDRMTILLTGEAPEQFAAQSGQFVTGLAVNSVLGSSSSRSFQLDPSGRLKVPIRVPIQGAKASLVFDLRPDANENQTEVTGEYQLSNNTLILGAVGDTHRYADVFYEYRF